MELKEMRGPPFSLRRSMFEMDSRGWASGPTIPMCATELGFPPPPADPSDRNEDSKNDRRRAEAFEDEVDDSKDDLRKLSNDVIDALRKLSMRREDRRTEVSPCRLRDNWIDDVRRDEVKSDMRLEDMALRLLMTSVARERI